MAFFRLEKRRPKEHLSTASCHLKEGYREDAESVSSERHTEKRQQTKAAAREILARYEEKFCPRKTGTAPKKVPREAGESPPLEMFRTCLCKESRDFI